LWSGIDEIFKLFPGWIYGKLDSMLGAGIVGGGQFVPSKIEGGLEIVDDIPIANLFLISSTAENLRRYSPLSASHSLATE
jgi:hypothetical protein